MLCKLKTLVSFVFVFPGGSTQQLCCFSNLNVFFAHELEQRMSIHQYLRCWRCCKSMSTHGATTMPLLLAILLLYSNTACYVPPLKSIHNQNSHCYVKEAPLSSALWHAILGELREGMSIIGGQGQFQIHRGAYGWDISCPFAWKGSGNRWQRPHCGSMSGDALNMLCWMWMRVCLWVMVTWLEVYTFLTIWQVWGLGTLCKPQSLMYKFHLQGKVPGVFWNTSITMDVCIISL